jgi:cyclopropane fatty-acyl-phospholipid synthase-like methyltransferase
MIPQRISWAIGLLKPWSGASILEIGCGRGVAAQALCEHLGPRGYVGIDRSKTAIDAAKKLNAEVIGRDVAEFVFAELADASFGRQRFDRILAINVNAFWTGGEKEIAAVQGILKAQGRMLLVYEAPSPARLSSIEEKLRKNLRAGGVLKLNTTRAPENAKLMAMWVSR